ncbi:hypothetical protein GCM10010917_12490 [Paenibacillus physcomitrellae]|uniref:Uncharacterized protein n=1 Tax=Paenibacillus physcomitrellae TaxID=1619311 RepID=A0ABQ1FTM3_9BACL|nr:hypothetical protein GCM10010917_12490 [Paenibacillus physcomitrellae]
MPDTEDRAGHSRKRIRVSGGQRSAKPGILHTGLEHNGFPFAKVHAEQFGEQVAKQVPEAVMQDDYSEDQQSAVQNFGAAASND